MFFCILPGYSLHLGGWYGDFRLPSQIYSDDAHRAVGRRPPNKPYTMISIGLGSGYAGQMEHGSPRAGFVTGEFLKIFTIVVVVFLFGLVSTCRGYSVLTHEAIIDTAWDPAIKPLLLSRFPTATPDELRMAHAYAYGGAVIQDMGYYPFGSKLFSDLVHYVRTGDFIEALLRDSQDINDYAFALGALAHYAADNNGHRTAVNKAVPMLFPTLRRKYGDTVVYDENPAAHLQTEFGFDVLQVARGRYAPDDYRDRIGFEVAKPLLRRAFEETYCVKLDDVFTNYDLAVGTYRHSVSAIIPQVTKVAWQVKKDEIQKEFPGINRKKFLYHISRRDYRKQWDGNYRQPGFGTQILAFFFRLIPKIGPFRALAVKTPTPETERLFIASFQDSARAYEGHIHDYRSAGQLMLVNDNFDTGTVTGPGQYPLADKTYADLMDRLSKNDFSQVSPELRKDLLAYYSDLNAPFADKKNKKQWAKIVKEVDDLKGATIASKAVSDSNACSDGCAYSSSPIDSPVSHPLP